MKEKLRQIYDELSRGNLAKQEALDKIRALKLRAHDQNAGTVFATPAWESSRISVSGDEPRSASDAAVIIRQQHIVLCEFPAAVAGELTELLSHSDCLALQAAEGNLAERYRYYAEASMRLIQKLLQSKPAVTTLIQIVIPGDAEHRALAGLSGLLATMTLENPDVLGQLIIAEPKVTAGELAVLLQENQAKPLDRIVRYQHGERQVLRWREQEAAKSGPQIAFKEGGVYLITGGLGGLGVLFAKEILRSASGAQIVLAGRSALSEDGAAKLRSLSGGTDQVTYGQIDVCSAEDVNAFIAGIAKRYGQLNGVIHAAGVVRDNFILKKTQVEFAEVLRPKVLGTLNLDCATRDLDLDFLVLFSSLSAALGNVGQADYAAANGFMDWFATQRDGLLAQGQRRGRTLSINWPLWRSGGMRIETASFTRLSEALGIQALEDAAGLEAFYRGLQLSHSRLLVMQGDVRKIRAVLAAHSEAPRADAAALERSPRSQPASHAPGDLAERTEQYLRERFATLLKLPAARIDPQAPLERYGIDSILAMNLTGELEKTFGSLSKTLFFEYQTLRELAGYLLKSHVRRLTELFGAAQPSIAEPPGAASAPASPRTRRGASQARTRRLASAETAPAHKIAAEPVAIVGLSGRFPQARDLEAYWQNLRDGRDCIEEVPAERWNWREYYSADRSQSDRHYSKWGGFIDGVDEFDPRFFNIAPRDAASIDPQERLFLQHCWMAIEDAGYTRESLQIPRASGLSGQVGVYAGVMYGEYNLAGSLASIANRVSYVLNLHGPSLTLDTMCSSSLTAIHLACQDLKSNRTDLALAGGVNVSIHPGKYSMLSAGQFISSDGHCQSFGEGGDGYIPAEGVGVVVLKRLSDAQRDGDPIYGIIRGSALNHGGKTNGYTVPNLQAQAGVISEVLADAQVDARHVSYVEAHGTGTKLGDPIEIAALSRAFQRHTHETGFCLIGSAKSNIGHGESAAGIAGLTKVLLQMKHRQIVPSLHSRRLNPHIDFANTPFVVNQQLTEWQTPVIEGRVRPRIAGISSFGAGGSNAHLIVEECPCAPGGAAALSQSRDSAVSSAETLIVLSARTAEQLQQKVRDLLQFARDASPDLASVAFTLQTGREAMAERLGLIVSSIEEIRHKLEAHLKGETEIEALYRGQVSLHREGASALMADADFEATVERWVERQMFAKLLSVWVQGFNLDWRRLWPVPPRRISLPAYPFAREKYWKAAGEGKDARPATRTSTTPASNTTGSEARVEQTGKFRTRLDAASATQPFATATLAKPKGIALQAASMQASASALVTLHDSPSGVLRIRIASAETNNLISKALIEQLLSAIEAARTTPSIKALILEGTQSSFLRGAADERCSSVYEAIARFPYPVIAAMRGDAHGAGFLAGAVCDFMICSRESSYRCGIPEAGFFPNAGEVRLLEERFGAPQAAEFLFAALTGEQLERRRWPCPIVPGNEVEQRALRLAETLAAMQQAPLRLLKQHLMRRLLNCVERLSADRQPLAVVEPELGGEVAAPTPLIALTTHGSNVLVVTLRAANEPYSLAALLGDLTTIVEQAGKSRVYKAIVLASERLDFLPQFEGEDVAALALQRLMLDCPFPIVAALQSDAADFAWLIAQSCDACICSSEGRYSVDASRERLQAAASALFVHRFGGEFGSEILLTGGGYSGAEIHARTGSANVAAPAEVLARALQLAQTWAEWPLETLLAWKRGSAAAARERIEYHDALTPARSGAPASLDRFGDDPAPTLPTSITLRSEVVNATAHPGGILVVTMEDRDARNMFSDALVDGLKEAFAHVRASAAYRVVVLTGYENYFASGGTRETLLAIQEGKAKFTDTDIYLSPLECEVPVIAAIQGHGIGAGWALGMFADLILLGEESKFLSPYMQYGFTPAAGSTAIFPEKIGYDLARETLFTAHEVAGHELQHKLSQAVLPRHSVFPAAMNLAAQIARASRCALVGLKRHLTQRLRTALPEALQRELAMHEETFVGNSDVLARIDRNFLGEERTMVETDPEAPQPAEVSAGRDRTGITRALRELLARELHLDVSEIDEHTQFVDLGLDSITGVTWVRKINERYHTTIEATKVYSHPTVAKLSQFVKQEADKLGVPAADPTRAAELAPTRPAAKAALTARPAPASTTETVTHGKNMRIAIVGMAGQFPRAGNIDEFWHNIAQGRDCIEEVPKQRWDVDAYLQEGGAAPGKTYAKWLGALASYDLFDAAFFNISPKEARNMDPQQRLFLQACWHCVEDAACNPKSLAGSRCGVFVGTAHGDYHRHAQADELSAQLFTGTAASILAARISYFLDLTGPCLSIDTACSSSLVAIANACDSLVAGGCDLALAGGVYVMTGPELHIKTSQAGMLSPDGKCFAFDQRANGFVPGEGVGVVMLKRLADAERDQDIIHAVIDGWGVNQDGRTNGITSPNPEAQSRLQQEVYRKFRVDPSNIQLIEAHGTGTKLGDPIEVEALKDSFGKFTQRQGYCAIGSVKSNIGHCLTAAGVSGVIKLVLALKHKMLPPTLHFEKLNEHIGLDGSPFYVNDRLRPWQRGASAHRQAAISSFGFSGTNAHAVLTEYQPAPTARVAADFKGGTVIVPMSARSAEQLEHQAGGLLRFLREQQQPDLMDVAYTLQVGREPMPERLGFVVKSVEELLTKLQAYVDGKRPIEGVVQGAARAGQAGIELIAKNEDIKRTLVSQWLERGELARLLDLWVLGVDLDWNMLYGGVKPRRLSLPTYPFAQERYWFAEQIVNESTRVEPDADKLLAVPVWKASAVERSEEDDDLQQHIVLCELPQVAALRLAADIAGRCVVLSAPQKTLGERYSEYALQCFEYLQQILESHPRQKALLQIVIPDSQEQSVFAGLSGLLRSAALEHPQLQGQLILTDPAITTDRLAEQLKDNRARAQDALIRYPQGVRHVLGWQEVASLPNAPQPAFKEGGVYLITGGLGGLGMIFAKDILEQTRAAKVILTGRAEPTAEKRAVLARLPTGGHSLIYRVLDLQNAGDVEQLVAEIVREHGALDGILHCAGMTSDSLILKKTAAQFAQVLGPKVAGTVNLDQATRTLDLDFFVLFSSVASAVGNLGQADYATANGFMDWFAAFRNALAAGGQRRGKAMSFNWALWKEGGIKVDAATRAMFRQTTGIVPMSTGTGLHAFHTALALADDRMLVVEGALPRLRMQFSAEENYQYANKAEEFYADAASRATVEFSEDYLTFCPFEEKRPGFSMSRVFLKPQENQEEAEYVRRKQIEMRQLLFSRVNFAEISSVLDFGCGHGTDVIQIGALFPHLRAHGCTITRDQATLGNRRIHQKRLQNQVRIFHQDSSKEPFAAMYDLVFGIEVSFHIRDKTGLFGNIRRSLNDGGRVLLMDYVCNLQGPIDDPAVEISIPTQKGWAKLTAEFGFEIEEMIDVSPFIANFLEDPEIDQNLVGLPEVSRKTLISYANQAVSLRKGWLSYVLIKLRKCDAGANLESRNLEKILNPVSYASAAQRAFEREYVQYPRNAAAPQPARALPPAPVAPVVERVSEQQLQQQLAKIVAAVLEMKTSAVDVNRPFAELGVDSILAVEMVIRINRQFGTEISNVKVFDFPSVKELSAFLHEELAKTVAVAPPARAVVAPEDGAPARRRAPVVLENRIGHAPQRLLAQQEKIAIVGMSGRYAGASNLQQFWTNVAEGRNSIAPMPPSRWDVEQYYVRGAGQEGKVNSKWLGALDDIECFDPLFFRIAPQEARHIDPQHRLFLQESYRAFEDAGYCAATLSNRKCGVYLGISTNEYALLLSQRGVISAPVTGNSYAIAAARIAYFLNLKGPAIAIDTACSSSLVAIHLACQGLLSRETDMALAGGVSLWLTPESYLGMSQAGMFSPHGQCRAFDDAADGIVVGEGVGAVVLKRLSDAIADRDSIHGVILASGVNQDGRTNGITAPSANSQRDLLREIYSRHPIDVESIGYIETHGTGTKLGDPIELEALAAAFGERTSKKNYCALASVKSNIGHTSSAAGVASVQKVLLSMRNRTLAPSLNVTKETSRFDFSSSPFYVNTEKKPWRTDAGNPLRAAVSSFGFSGTNAHLVIEEYVPPQAASSAASAPSDDFAIVLSARTPEQLQEKARDLLQFVRSNRTDLMNLSYTLQVGREAMEERLGLVVHGIDGMSSLATKLQAVIEGETGIEGVWRGRANGDEDALGLISSDGDMQAVVGRWLADRKLVKLLPLWIKGAQLEWRTLYAEHEPRRISLPVYPFAKERCWIDAGGRHQSHPHVGVDESIAGQTRIDAMIDAFERGKLSQQDFIRFLDGLPEDALSEVCEKRLVEVIKRTEQGGARPVSNVRPMAPVVAIGVERRQKARPNNSASVASGPPESISAQIISNVAEVLGLDCELIEVNKSFQDYGLDSISAARLSVALEKEFRTSVPPNWLIEFSTVAALADRMKQEVA